MDKIKDLEGKILYHKALYYQGSPEISDGEYDKLEEQLAKLDPNNKVLRLVGTAPRSGEKVKHASKMLSLNKVYEADELESWRDGRDDLSSLKFDGLSCSVIYEDSKLVLGKTRGDGSFGEDMTSKVRWISDVAGSLQEKSVNAEVRGEIYCTEENFFMLSNEMEKLGLEKP